MLVRPPLISVAEDVQEFRYHKMLFPHQSMNHWIVAYCITDTILSFSETMVKIPIFVIRRLNKTAPYYAFCDYFEMVDHNKGTRDNGYKLQLPRVNT